MVLVLQGAIRPGATVKYQWPGTGSGYVHQRTMHCLSERILVSTTLKIPPARIVARLHIDGQTIDIPEDRMVFVGCTPQCDIFINDPEGGEAYFSLQRVRLPGYFDPDARTKAGTLGMWHAGKGIALRLRAGSEMARSLHRVRIDQYPYMRGAILTEGESMDLTCSADITLLARDGTEIAQMRIELVSNEELGGAQWDPETAAGIARAKGQLRV